MRVDRLEVRDFRNIGSLTLFPDEQLTILCGANGQGKTNLLEAVWLLTGAKSFRTNRDAELVRRGQRDGLVAGEYKRGAATKKIRIAIGGAGSAHPGRAASVNGVPIGRAAAAAGEFTAVVFEPDHLRLIKDGPAMRRRFIDAAACQCWPAHVATLRRYHHILAQKNALLRNYEAHRDAGDMLEAFNDALAKAGGAVIARRALLTAGLLPRAAAYYREMCGGKETMTVFYHPCTGRLDPGAAPPREEALVQALAQKIREVGGAERRVGYCLAGPHRDDLEILLDGGSSRTYGSQGQQRSAVLALKMAEGDVLGDVLGEKPVMLLDDVLSELDVDRQDFLLNHIGGQQTIVTTCDTLVYGRAKGMVMEVRAGHLGPW